MLFEPDKELDAVVAREAADGAGAMLLNAGEEVRGYADVEGAVAL